MRRILCLLLASVMLTCVFAACSAPNLEGRYTLKTINGKAPLDYFKDEAAEDDIDVEMLFSLLGLTEETVSEYIVLTLEKDGKSSIAVTGEDTETGTWDFKDGYVIITDGDETTKLKYDNGTLSIEENGQAYVFTK